MDSYLGEMGNNKRIEMGNSIGYVGYEYERKYFNGKRREEK